MFSIAAYQVNPFGGDGDKVKWSKVNTAGVVADIIAALGLVIVGALVAAGIMNLSPAAAYGMIGVGALQLGPFLLGALAIGSVLARGAIEKCRKEK